MKQDKVTYAHGKIVKIYIVYEIKYNISNYTTLGKYLFGTVNLTKNADTDMYKYSGYSIRFNIKGKFSVGYRFGRNCIILRVNISSSIRVDDKNKDILFFGKGPTQDTRIRW